MEKDRPCGLWKVQNIKKPKLSWVTPLAHTVVAKHSITETDVVKLPLSM
jgi:hypothetical protein